MYQHTLDRAEHVDIQNAFLCHTTSKNCQVFWPPCIYNSVFYNFSNHKFQIVQTLLN